MQSYSISRRSLLQAGAVAPLKTAGARAIDIHAHFFPQSYLDVVASDGARFKTSYKIANGQFSIQSPSATNFAPVSIVDVKARIAEMDRQGVAMQALSLTGPMVYFGDTEFNHRLAKAWNDGASAAHGAYPDRLAAFM